MVRQHLGGALPKPNPPKKVTAKKAVAPKSIQKPSTKTTKKTAKEASAKAKGSENVSAEKDGSKNFQKKTSPGSEKGKVVVMERNDSDDDYLHLDNTERMREAMAKCERKTEPRNLLLSACL